MIMFRIVSFILLLSIIIVLLYGLETNKKDKMNDVHDLKTGYSINQLYVNEVQDSPTLFSGFAHSFYIYVSEPYQSDVSVVSRGEFNIKVNSHNILTVSISDDSIDYMLPLSKWVHIVVNINPHALELYVDGALLKSNINSSGHYTSDFYGENIVLGGNGSVSERNGWIASYKYYDSPLHSKKINTMYQENINKYNTLRDEYGVLVTFNKNEQELARYAF